MWALLRSPIDPNKKAQDLRIQSTLKHHRGAMAFVVVKTIPSTKGAKGDSSTNVGKTAEEVDVKVASCVPR